MFVNHIPCWHSKSIRPDNYVNMEDNPDANGTVSVLLEKVAFVNKVKNKQKHVYSEFYFVISRMSTVRIIAVLIGQHKHHSDRILMGDCQMGFQFVIVFFLFNALIMNYSNRDHEQEQFTKTCSIVPGNYLTLTVASQCTCI